MSSRPATPVSVITGFLGSGKTTLLNALLRHPEMRDTAVLVNEFGEIGIDHLLVEALQDEETVLLNAGCLCCTIRDDLVSTLVSLDERRAAGAIPPFRQVVIETTGLADPAPILHTLIGHEALERTFRVDAIVTTVDAVNGARQLDRHRESLRQAAVADRLLLTKTDLAPRPDADALRARLRGINRGAPLLEARHGAVAPSRLFGAGPFGSEGGDPRVERWLAEAAYRDEEGHAHHDLNRHDDRIRAWCLEAARPLPMPRFIAWVERLIERHGDALLRLKGGARRGGERGAGGRARGAARVPSPRPPRALAPGRAALAHRGHRQRSHPRAGRRGDRGSALLKVAGGPPRAGCPELVEGGACARLRRSGAATAFRRSR